MANVAKPGVARVSTRAVSTFIPTPESVAGEGDISLQHVFAAWSKAPASAPRQPLIRAKVHESNEIALVMSGVLTRVRPAPSTQTIENKRIILRHRARPPRKQGKYPYMRHFATFCDIL